MQQVRVEKSNVEKAMTGGRKEKQKEKYQGKLWIDDDGEEGKTAQCRET